VLVLPSIKDLAGRPTGLQIEIVLVRENPPMEDSSRDELPRFIDWVRHDVRRCCGLVLDITRDDISYKCFGAPYRAFLDEIVAVKPRDGILATAL
jgi:hypothetical protein